MAGRLLRQVKGKNIKCMSCGAPGLYVKVDDVVCMQKCQPGRNVEREQAPLAIPVVYDLGL